MISGTPASWAIFAKASISVIKPPGLAMLSAKSALVLSVIWALKLSGSRVSAHFTCQSNLAKLWEN